ncbi:MAG: hypothetical protein WBK08_15450 [Nitrospira sp.]
MNQLLVFGLVGALLVFFIYLGFAASQKKQPQLVDGIIVFLGCSGLPGAARLIGFPFTDQFTTLTRVDNHGSLWALSAEDSAFLIIGGIALGWVCVQTVIESFSKLK